MTNRQNLWIKHAFKLLREDYGNRCLHCFVTENLEFAHVKVTGLSGWGRGRKERYYDIVNNRDSYVLVCAKHHVEHYSEVN